MCNWRETQIFFRVSDIRLRPYPVAFRGDMEGWTRRVSRIGTITGTLTVLMCFSSQQTQNVLFCGSKQKQCRRSKLLQPPQVWTHTERPPAKGDWQGCWLPKAARVSPHWRPAGRVQEKCWGSLEALLEGSHEAVRKHRMAAGAEHNVWSTKETEDPDWTLMRSGTRAPPLALLENREIIQRSS